ncbi:MAG: potassium-transporting ATPase subunit KdpA [Synechococcaceae cyanobacterium]
MASWLLVLFTLAAVLVAAFPLGRHLWQVFSDQPQPRWDRWQLPLEQALLHWIGDGGQPASRAWDYARPLLLSNLVFALLALALLRGQPPLLNPLGWPGLRWDTALHTAIAFVTNTDQQHYVPERSLGAGVQLAALQFRMFVSPATGLAFGFAVVRGVCGQPLGNFHRDLIRSLSRVLIPASLVLAVVLLFCGVPMTLAAPFQVITLEGGRQWLQPGPVALFEAIKLLGGNGGGYFTANSAHPYENPSLLSNLLETGAMLLLPAASVIAFGRFLGNRRQAAWLLALLAGLLLLGVTVAGLAEQGGNPLLRPWIEGANLEGKELRFGAVFSGLWAASTTGSMTGASNGSLDSLLPWSALVAMFNLLLQLVFGGVGTGLATVLAFLVLSVFITGLMVGRTPEFLGRKLEQPEVVCASLVLLIHPLFVLVPAAVMLTAPASVAGLSNPGPHGVLQVVYEYASAAANNGSAMAGLHNTSAWWNLSASVSLLGGRYLPMLALLALAESLSRKPSLPAGVGSLRTDTGLFTLVSGVLFVVVGALSFFPVLALGPLAEGFQLPR